MVKVTPTTEKEVEEFNLREWAKVDQEKYGQDVEWREKYVVLKAEENGEIAGSLKMKIEAGVADLQVVIVAEGKRGKGVGRALMEEAEKIAKEEGCHNIDLVTGKHWSAVKFYQSLGYKLTAQIPYYYNKKDFVEFNKYIG
ncbi:MAG: GNAT family N-acetyltransferase [bacterium]|nr:GNAT family N-acetyltransferase [bacterium]